MNPIVTIAIPAYKSAYLREAISSALNQTVHDIEVIVVNDHSPENLDTIVNEFNDERLSYYVNEKNLGGQNIVLNWNKCLSLAKGEYFCLLCDDDLYEPGFLEEMLKLAQKYPSCNVFRSRVKMINGAGHVTDYYPVSPEYETVPDYMFHREKDLRQQTVSEFMLKTLHIRQMGGYMQMPVGWESDIASIYIFGQDGGIVTSPQSLVSFRQSGINISTGGRFMKEKIAALNRFSRLINQLLEDNETDKEYAKIINRWRDIKVNRLKFEYLRITPWKDLTYLWKHRYSEDVLILPKDFFIAMFYRAGYSVVRIMKKIVG